MELDEDALDVLVVDTGALVKGVRVDTMGRELVTVPEVVEEVRDRHTRAFVKHLPKRMLVREPSAEAISAVAAFARKTGDFASLSRPDLKVIALAYHLEKEQNGVEHLRTEPIALKAAQEKAALSRQREKAKKARKKRRTKANKAVKAAQAALDNALQQGDDAQPQQVQEARAKLKVAKAALAKMEADGKKEVKSFAKRQRALEAKFSVARPGRRGGKKGKKGKASAAGGMGGWGVKLTPKNYKEVMGDTSAVEKGSKAGQIGIVTTDFAMQNVILQMGLHLVSVEGMVVRKVRQTALRCHACGALEMNAERIFCGTCGNKALIKATMTVGKDGNVEVRGGYKRVYNLRGTRYSIPKPKGGKKNPDMVLREDMLHKTGIPRSRWGAKPQKVTALDPDLGTHFDRPNYKKSKYAKAQIGYGKQNPNDWRKPKNR